MQSLIKNIDPLSFCVVPLTLFRDDLELSKATGFFFANIHSEREKPHIWLVSNWHVFSGRTAAPPHNSLDSKGAIPNRLRFEVMKVAVGSDVEIYEQFVSLYGNDGVPIWYQHKKCAAVDIAAVNLGYGMDGFAAHCVNVEARHDMRIDIGSNVFILGYPLGFSHFMKTPIWKRGSIASEPHLEVAGSEDRIVIDATTRGGMSGSPVILRERSMYVAEDGAIKPATNPSRFLGVYSSRPALRKTTSSVDGIDDFRTELGYVYKSGRLVELVREGIRGPRYGELP
jgi:hypothetical protein